MKNEQTAQALQSSRALGPIEDPCCEAPAAQDIPSVADAVTVGLAKLGVEHAFGISGRALAPFMDALLGSSIHVVHTRHESGAAFAALEASLVTGRPTLVFTTTGPGITNALTGLVAARREGGRVILVSPSTSAAQRHRGAFQETGPHTLLRSLYCAGEVFHDAMVLETPESLPVVLRHMAVGLARRGGYLAHLSLPVAVQLSPWDEPVSIAPVRVSQPRCDENELRRCVEAMAGGRGVIWVGYGARHASEALVRLAEGLRSPVIATPRAKGTFPEGHPLYLGVTGLGGDPRVAAVVESLAPEHILVLGTRLGEYSSLWAPGLRPRQSFIVVDAHMGGQGGAYFDAEMWGVRAEVAGFVEGMADLVAGPGEGDRPPRFPVMGPALVSADLAPGAGAPGPEGVHPAALMEAVERVFVQGSNAVIFTEAGNAFAWGSRGLRFDQPNRYRTSMGWGSMGAASAGVLGAALARRGKALALVGDGAMLMQSEVSTAVAHGLQVVWVVLNDGQYGMLYHGMSGHGLSTEESRFTQVDFGLWARSMGCPAERACNEDQLYRGLELALEAEGPFLLDVVVDPSVPPPLITRISGADASSKGANGGRGAPGSADREGQSPRAGNC